MLEVAVRKEFRPKFSDINRNNAVDTTIRQVKWYLCHYISKSSQLRKMFAAT